MAKTEMDAAVVRPGSGARRACRSPRSVVDPWRRNPSTRMVARRSDGERTVSDLVPKQVLHSVEERETEDVSGEFSLQSFLQGLSGC